MTGKTVNDHGNGIPIRNGNPMGMGQKLSQSWEWGWEWKKTWMGMRMTPFPWEIIPTNACIVA